MTPGPPDPAGDHSRTVDVDGPIHCVGPLHYVGPTLHYVDHGRSGAGPTIVLVHGLGGSHLNWDLLAPKLTGHGHVLAPDLPGFGLSAPRGRAATVRANVDVLAGFVRATSDAPVVLVGNSMGGLIAVLLAARMPQLVRGLVLLDPALPAPGRVTRSPADAALLAAYALPGVGERLRRTRRERIGAMATVHDTFRLGGVDPAALPADLVERHVAIVERQAGTTGADRAFLSASRSLAGVLTRAVGYRAAMASIRVPVLLLHGDRDRLVPVAAARATARRHPQWRYVELPGVGHLPQLQAPDDAARHLTDWLARLPGPACTEHRESR